MKLEKVQLYTHCETLLNERVNRLQSLIESAQQAANDETKSSVGDKYETGRAMMQGEKDRLAAQLSEALSLVRVLRSIRPQEHHEIVQLGSAVVCNGQHYFIGPALGKIVIGTTDVFVISPASPVGQLLIGKQAGETISFRGNEQMISSIA